MDAEQAHQLERWLPDTETDDVRDFLLRNPPSPAQADALAAIELVGKDRPEIYEILRRYRDER